MSRQLHAAYVQLVRISSPRDTARLDRSGHFGCLQAKGQSPWHLRLHERTRSQGPFLRQRYPASSVIRPCPTPADIAIQDSVEVATLMPKRVSPVTRITFPACRAHYPGGSNGCMCRLLPHPCGLPRFAGGSASASLLSRPAQASLALRPVGLLNRPRRPSSRGFDPAGCPTKPLASYQSNRQFPGWNLPPLLIRAFGAHCINQDIRSKARLLLWRGFFCAEMTCKNRACFLAPRAL